MALFIRLGFMVVDVALFIRLGFIVWTREILHYDLLEGFSGGLAIAAHGIRVPMFLRWPQLEFSLNDLNKFFFPKMFTVKVSQNTFMSSR
jgi:hypothetical protein